MAQLGQAPKPAEHGSFLQKASVAGERVEFVQQSNTVSGTLTLGAAGSPTEYGYIQVNLDITEPAFVGPTVDFDNIVAWNYVDLWVDSIAQDNAYLWRQGPSLTTAQLNIEMNHYDQIDASSAVYSHTRLYFFKNSDSSGHTITIKSTWKYITTAGTEV